MSQSILSLKAVISEKKYIQKQQSGLPKKRKEKDDYSHTRAVRVGKETEQDEEEQRRMSALQKKAKLYNALKSSAGSNLHDTVKDSFLIDFSRSNDKKVDVTESREELSYNESLIGKVNIKQNDFLDRYSQNHESMNDDNNRDYYEKAALKMSLKHVIAEVDYKPVESERDNSDQTETISNEAMSKYVQSHCDELGRIRPPSLAALDHRRELLLHKKKQLTEKIPAP